MLPMCAKDLYWMREAELKHARVAMLAVVGSVAQEAGVVFPGLVSALCEQLYPPPTIILTSMS